MSGDKSLFPGRLVPRLKDSAILVGWISGLILLAGLFWFLTQPVRTSIMIRAVNKVLAQSGDIRRLGEAQSRGSLGMGTWFTMEELPNQTDTGREKLAKGSRAYVFAFIGEGFFFPCAAVVSPGGNVEEFIPLSDHGKRMIKRVSPGIIKIYSLRIEGVES